MGSKSEKQLATSRRKLWLQKLQPTGAKTKSGESKPRIVIDTNIWYSAILYGGKPEAVVNWCLQNGEIVISEHILDELMTEIRANTNAPYRWRRAILDGLQKATILAEFDELPNIVRDPKDNHVIAAALSANAQIIVTGDQDLLILKQVENIQILKSADFMEQTV